MQNYLKIYINEEENMINVQKILNYIDKYCKKFNNEEKELIFWQLEFLISDRNITDLSFFDENISLEENFAIGIAHYFKEKHTVSEFCEINYGLFLTYIEKNKRFKNEKQNLVVFINNEIICIISIYLKDLNSINKIIENLKNEDFNRKINKDFLKNSLLNNLLKNKIEFNDIEFITI